MAAVHLLAGALRFLDGIPRSRWLSAAGGVSVAYVCLHLLPELDEGSEVAPVYEWVLAGLTVFYVLERSASLAGEEGSSRGGRLFWVSISGYAVYNAMIGYTVNRRSDVIWYVLAMTVHFIVNDHGLRERYRRPYDAGGRWLLAGAVLAGGAAAHFTEVPEPIFASMLAFIGGGVILNVFKEELPGERESRLLPFLLGAAGFAALLRAG